MCEPQPIQVLPSVNDLSDWCATYFCRAGSMVCGGIGRSRKVVASEDIALNVWRRTYDRCCMWLTGTLLLLLSVELLLRCS